MTETSLPTAAVIYVRISDDREGVGAGVGRQEQDSRDLAARLGWGVAAVLVENDTSAFKRRRVKRPNGTTELRVVRPKFRQALDMLAAGSGDALIAYDLDRTARDPRDLEDLIDVVEQRTPRVPVRSVTGSLRLDNDADITMARVMVAIANKSSRDTQRRVARAHEELAKAGKYGGGGARRFGYAVDGVTVVEHEAAVIREAADRILAGEAAHSICLDFQRREIPTARQTRWSSTALIGILRSARIAGLRTHRGEVVGPAVWPAIVEPATRDLLLAQLAENSHGAGKMALRYWCNRLLWCSRCGEPLTGGHMTGGRYRYWCATNRSVRGCGRIAVAGPQVEAEIERQVLEYFQRPDVLQTLAAGSESVAVEETRRLLDADQRMLADLAQAFGERQISLPEWLAARGPVEARVKTYSQALRSVVPARVRDVLESSDRGATWASLDPATRREVVQVILATDGLKGWLVAAADVTKPRQFDAERLSWLHA